MKGFQRTTAFALVFGLALLLTVGGFGVAAASPEASAGDVDVSLEPANQSVGVGGNAAYDIVVGGATDSIGAYSMTLELDNTSVGTVTGFNHEYEPQFDNTEIYDDRVEIAAAMGDNTIPPGEETVIGTVDVSGDSTGETGIAFANGTEGTELTDDSDTQYNVVSVASGSLTVEASTIDVGLVPAEQTTSAGSNTTYDLVIEGATEGISGYTATLNLGNSSVATVEDFEQNYEPQFDNSSTTDSSVSLEAAMGDNAIAPGEEIVLGTLTVSGDAPGTTGIVFDEQTIEVSADDGSVTRYNVGAVTDGSLEVTNADPVTVELVPLDPVTAGEVELGVVVTNASNGVSAYEVGMTSNSSNMTFVDHELTAEGDSGPLDNSEYSDDNSSFLLSAALLDAAHDPAEEIRIANVTVDIAETGVYEIGHSTLEVRDLDGNFYPVNADGLVLSANIPPIVGDQPPTDPDNDGQFEDIDGDTDFDVFDVQALFDNLDNPDLQNNPAAFNFNNDDNPGEAGVTIFDVQALFEELETSD